MISLSSSSSLVACDAFQYLIPNKSHRTLKYIYIIYIMPLCPGIMFLANPIASLSLSLSLLPNQGFSTRVFLQLGGGGRRGKNKEARAMGSPLRAATALLVAVLMLVAQDASGRHASRHILDHRHRHQALAAKSGLEKRRDWYDETSLYWKKGRRQETVDRVAGSSLPDCSHACGSCRPCRLVMVSFVCASLEEAETCPMAYRCMCNSRSYPVP